MEQYPDNESLTVEQQTEIKRFLHDLHRQIENPKHNSVPFVTSYLHDFCIQLGRSDFPEIESLLREMNSRIFLLAVPLKKTKKVYLSRLPGSTLNYPYGLWISLSSQDAQQAIEHFGISSKNNAVNLANCGFVLPLLN